MPLISIPEIHKRGQSIFSKLRNIISGLCTVMALSGFYCERWDYLD